MAIFIHLVGGRIPDLSNDSKIDEYCKRVEKCLNEYDSFVKKIDHSINEFDKIKEKWIETKGMKFAHAIKDNSLFDSFMFENIGFRYSKLSQKSKNEDFVYTGVVTAVKKDRNGFNYCYIKADPTDVFVHEDASPKTLFANLVGKTVKYKIISSGKYNNPKGKIIKVLPKEINVVKK